MLSEWALRIQFRVNSKTYLWASSAQWTSTEEEGKVLNVLTMALDGNEMSDTPYGPYTGGTITLYPSLRKMDQPLSRSWRSWWRLVISFTSWSHQLWCKVRWYTLKRRRSGSQNRCRPLPLPGIEPRLLGGPGRQHTTRLNIVLYKGK